MAAIIRTAIASDAPRWLELVRIALGTDYPSKEIYDLAWITRQLDPSSGHETWVAEVDGQLNASISFLGPSEVNRNPIANLGRNLHRPESFTDGSAKALLRKINEIAIERSQIVVARVSSMDNPQQILYENADFSCVGFQPFKHMLQARIGVLYYVRLANQILMTRLPLSESLLQINELASVAFEKLKISNPLTNRDGAVGYPLQTDVKLQDATGEEFRAARQNAETSNPPVEISSGFNHGVGMMRVENAAPIRAVLAKNEEKIISGIAFYFDEIDRCTRVVDAFAIDDLSTGALFQYATKKAQEENAVYIEVDILVTAPRLLKSAEQLGYVPIAYLPAFYSKKGSYADVVKMVKLNMPYAHEKVTFTAEARSIAEIIDRNFEDQKIGMAIINLLRGLPIFDGLGDGELRKIARLFTQKLYRPKEQIFKKGDSGDAAYIVMRGQVDIQLEENSPPIASVSSGKIFGELAFLDGAPRNAYAVAGQASILLEVHRNALNVLVQREPHLGMVVMRNVAMDLSNKLRQANAAIAGLKK